MKIPLKPFYLFLSVAVLLFSCSDDDGDDGESDPQVLNVIGTWTLVRIDVSAPIDANLDGTSSSNVLDESDCPEETLVIEGNFEWRSTVIAPGGISQITGDLYSVTCLPVQNQDGDWGVSGNNLILVGSANRTFLVSGDQLFEDIGEDLPGIRTFVYARQ